MEPHHDGAPPPARRSPDAARVALASGALPARFRRASGALPARFRRASGALPARFRRASAGVRLVVRGAASAGALARAAWATWATWATWARTACWRVRQRSGDRASILQEVKAVGDLLGLRRPQGRSGGRVAAPIATDEPYLGARLQPAREGQLRAVGQPVDDATPLPVEQDGAVGTAAPEGEVIDAQHAHWRRGGIVTAGQEAQDRLIGDPHAQGGGDRFGAAAACGRLRPSPGRSSARPGGWSCAPTVAPRPVSARSTRAGDNGDPDSETCARAR
jgi:hypothetical protein